MELLDRNETTDEETPDTPRRSAESTTTTAITSGILRQMQRAASDLTWKDAFFDEREDIVAVFDFDRRGLLRQMLARAFFHALGLAIAYGLIRFVISLLFSNEYPIVWASVVVTLVIFLVSGVIESRRAFHSVAKVHLALTTEGILFVQDRKPYFLCFSGGRVLPSRKIRYEDMRSCGIDHHALERACFCINAPLSRVDITYDEQDHTSFFPIIGLEHPEVFHDLVAKCKELLVGTPPSTSISIANLQFTRNDRFFRELN